MKIGFTGTRRGCTKAQLAALLDYLASKKITEFHHGRCIGSDTDAHHLVRSVHPNARIVLHPSSNPRWQSDVTGELMLPPKPPLDRNKTIVRSTWVLVACPAGMEEELRSGTWATVRFARSKKRPITYVWPDGTITEE